MKRRDYTSARCNAARRGIPFYISFEDWSEVWRVSGKWEERGKRRGQYQMDRIDPSKGYERENVQIISGALNRVKDSPHGWVAILDETKVAEIRRQYMPHVVTKPMLAESYGVSVACIKAVLSRRNWRAVA